MTQPVSLHDQVLSIEIEAPVEDVWNEITKTGSIQKALYNTVLETDLTPGSRLRYYSPNKKRVFIVGEVVEVSPPTKFSHTYLFLPNMSESSLVRSVAKDVTIEALLDLAKRYKPRTIFGESGVIMKAAEPFLHKRMRDRGDSFTFEWLTRTADKQAHARGFQAMVNRHNARREIVRAGLVGRLPNRPWASGLALYGPDLHPGRATEGVSILR